MESRQIPHDIDNEEALLGALIIDSESINKINIKPQDFYSERNSIIFKACQQLKERSVHINQVTLANELNSHLDKIGGVAYLSHCVGCCPTSLDIEYYAEILSRLSFYRRMIDISEQIKEIGFKAESNISQSINTADDLLLELRKGQAHSVVISPEEKQQMMLNRYLKLQFDEGAVAVSTGLKDLDYQLGGGLYNGDLTIVGARTGMGKTTFLQNLANNIAQDGNVLYVSMEMSVLSLGDRDVASFAGVPTTRIRLGKYDEDLYNKISQAVNDINKTKIYTYDETPIDTGKILQVATNLKLRKGLMAIIVDYLGLLDDNVGENRNITLGYMTKKLKQVAMQLDIPVLVAHQLSREVEKRENKRPVLADLRESGHIEEDADIVLFLYRDSYYLDKNQWDAVYTNKKTGFCPEYPENLIEVIFAKHRQGDTGFVKLYFDKIHQKFFDLAK